jgi:putative flippase GtrA
VSATITRGRWQLARAFLRDIRSPDWGLFGQGFRFALAGSLVAVVYVSVTTLLHDVFAVPFQIALVIGFSTGVALHFTLQRLFVWRHRERFALGINHQALRYLLVCATQYGVTALSTTWLPGALGLQVEAVYVITMLAVSGLNFLVFRGRVFHPGSRRSGSESQPTARPSRDAMS